MKRQDGTVILTAFIVTIILALLGMTLWQYVMLDFRTNIIEEQQVQAYYIAKAGAEAVADWIINDPAPSERATALDGLTSNLTSLDEDLDGKFQVEVFNQGENTIISSTGYVGKTFNTVNLKLTRLDVPFDFDKALFIGNGLKANEQAIILDGSAKIEGPVYLGSGSIQFNNLDNNEIKDGILYIGQNTFIPPEVEAKMKDRIVEINTNTAPKVPELPLHPSPPTFHLAVPLPNMDNAEYMTDLDITKPIVLPKDSVKVYESINLPWDSKLEFNLTDGDAIVQINSIQENGSDIIVNGSGHLTLIINGDFNWSGNINKAGDDSQLTIIIKGDKFNLTQSNRTINATIYCPNANNQLSLMSDTIFKGDLLLPRASLITDNKAKLTGSVYVGGELLDIGSHNTITGLIYAPNAEFKSGYGTNIFGDIVLGRDVILNGTILDGSLYALNRDGTVEFNGNRENTLNLTTKVYSKGNRLSLSAHFQGEVHLSNKSAELVINSGSTFDGVVYSAGNYISTKNDSTFTGFIYSTNTESRIEVLGGSGSHGSIISAGESIKIQGGSAVMMGIIYAPDADVQISKGSRVIGSVVARTLDGGGDGIPLKYASISTSSFPLPIIREGADGKTYSKLWFD